MVMNQFTLGLNYSNTLKYEQNTNFWQKLDSIDRNDFMVSVTDTEHRSVPSTINNRIWAHF